MQEFDWDPFEDESTGSAQTEKQEKLETRVLKRFRENEQMHVVRAMQLSEFAPFPSPGERYIVVTGQALNAYVAILDALKRRSIEELYVATFSINEPTLRAILELCRLGQIRYAAFLFNGFFLNNKKEEKWPNLIKEAAESSNRIRYAFTWNHAKVTAFKTGSDYIVLSGSGNMNAHARIEQYTYENDRDIFEFHRGWILDEIEKNNAIGEQT